MPKADPGHVFRTSSKSFSEEEAKKFSEKIFREGFDPHYITTKIIEFGKILTGIPIYSYQYDPIYRIIYSVITIEGAVLTMLFSRQSGKTEAVAFVIDTLAVILPALTSIFPELEQYKDGIKIGLFAPQSDQVSTTYGRCMTRLGTENAQLVMQDPGIDIYLQSEVNLRLSNGSHAFGQVASKQSKVESKTYDLIFCEEAQDLDSYMVQKSIEPMTSATSGTIVKVGTTGTTKNHFWFDIQDNIRNNRKVKDARLMYHFENDYKKVIQAKREQHEKDGKLFHLNYEKDVLRKRERWGEESDAFRLGYGLKWALDSGMFFTDKDWKLMINQKMGFPSKIESSWMTVAGLDIAKESARTILTIGQVIEREEGDAPIKKIIGWVDLKGHDYEEQHYAIMNALVDYNVRVLYADYTGVGKPVVDRLMYACGEHVHIVPYTFTRPSKSDMWTNLMNDTKQRRIIVPANKAVAATEEFQEFESQMKALQKWYEGSYLVAEKAEGEFDDYCDSLALMALAGNDVRPPEIQDDDYNPLLDGLGGRISEIKRNSW